MTTVAPAMPPMTQSANGAYASGIRPSRRGPAFFERFTRTMGVPPMEYLLAWRMTVARDLLRRHDLALVEVAGRVGYGSASSFSTAFSRHVGQPPSAYARSAAAAAT